MKKITQVISKMINYYSGDPKRVGHFMKVYSFAKTIGEAEQLDEKTQEILEIAAATHDIGIKVSEHKYNSSAGKHQEHEGPALAEKMLVELDVERSIIDRVMFLIAHHHTYEDVSGIDYRILIEADFLVNAYEDNLSKDAIKKAKDIIFRTETGTKFLNDIFSLDE
ncbi:MAG: HD domain-containing protein [Clostridia bacterium]|nr:HD domain-containing protein [Clostridia bacterium]